MNKKVVSFYDGSFLNFCRGSFDNWCISLTRKNYKNFKPFDWQYFKKLKVYASKYGKESLYNDFVSIYNMTTKEISNDVFDYIKNISKKYEDNELNICIIFSILYMAMIAEENKKGTKLGKRIKRLGVYQTLIEDKDYMCAACYSRGMKWYEIDKDCKLRGF